MSLSSVSSPHRFALRADRDTCGGAGAYARSVSSFIYACLKQPHLVFKKRKMEVENMKPSQVRYFRASPNPLPQRLRAPKHFYCTSFAKGGLTNKRRSGELRLITLNFPGVLYVQQREYGYCCKVSPGCKVSLKLLRGVRSKHLFHRHCFLRVKNYRVGSIID